MMSLPAANPSQAGTQTRIPRPDTASVSRDTGSTMRARAPAGTQVVSRAVAILREIAAHGGAGLRLIDLATHLHIERPTVHRILQGLAAEGMVRQDQATRRYHLGHLVYELGLGVEPRFNLKEICEPMLQRLAQQTGDSVFLMARSGLDAVCVHQLDGSFPIRAQTLRIGGRRPLGIGAASLALLLALPDEQIEQILVTNAPRFARFGRTNLTHLRQSIALSREVGYAVNDEDVLVGVAAIGVALCRSSGLPFAAVSISTISSRLASPRREQIAQKLIHEARLMERALGKIGDFWD